MSDIVIKVEGLSKRYRLGQYVGGAYQYRTLRDVLTNAMYAPFRRLRTRSKRQAVGSNPTADSHELSAISYQPSANFIWALKDVSFEVKQGEVLGIIGRNGAGKSTLLKLLSRITEPTEGRAEIKGRIGSLLEVGTGFHPELTGRENVYLSGAILGMTKKEIGRKFDEIVDFSGIEKFIDTPVKRYSSGMLVRLGFAIAAHLEPEILLVDEVLAVGDAAFQKKCLGKMSNVTKEGRTVLFVSHNMGAITRLCNRILLLGEGKLEKDGMPTDVISEYLKKNSKTNQHFLQPVNHSIPICLMEAEVFSEGSGVIDSFPRHKPITVRLKYKINREISSVHVYSNIMSADGTVVLGTGDADVDQSRLGLRRPGTYVCQYQLPARTLNEGNYTVSISLGVPYQRNFQENTGILSFSVVDVEPIERFVHQRRAGIIWLDIPWRYLGDNSF